MKFDISENVYWAFVWLLAAATLSGIVVANVVYYSDKNRVYAKAISASIDPVATACALKFEHMVDKSLCVPVMSK